ncbi:hypothetical protein G7046_g8973 [Stylonectria norvegica]|nr:hypothetical protein G7046_g8973 [Stylonectria norvegica]
MSLNGLDDPKVQEAHEAAVAEPGGWFLLKYATRDEVEVLSRGNGGIVEIRNKIAEYDETSPLYGFLRYRRRNVLIKYLPEDCSRLIQARVAVHFNAVCERFTPYDTTFEISTAKELKDTKLSAACSLHAASGSNSSSNSSLRRRRLMEIAEEEEEEQRATKRQSIVQEDDELPSLTTPVTLNSDLATSPEETSFSATSTSELPNFVGVDDGTTSPSDAAPRLSSQSSRPAELFNYSPYTYGKPKVKLGPRPSLDVTGRPRTAGAFRPVSQIPAGFKLFGKGSKKAKGKDDSDADATSPTDDFSENPFAGTTTSIPEEPLRPLTEMPRPATSSGVSTKSTTMPPPAKPTMTREKARLMKAMKLREKRKNMTLESSSGAPSPTLESPVPSEEEPAETPTEEKANTDDTPSIEAREEGGPSSMINADSGIGLDASSLSTNTDQTSEVTLSDSHPTSPILASSEPGHSTKASSLSESTDETVQAKSEDALEEAANEETYGGKNKEDGGDDAPLDQASIVEECQVENEQTPILTENKPEDELVAELLLPDVYQPENTSKSDLRALESTENSEAVVNPVTSQNEPETIDSHVEPVHGESEEHTGATNSESAASIPASQLPLEVPTLGSVEAETERIPDTPNTLHVREPHVEAAADVNNEEDKEDDEEEDEATPSPSQLPLRIPKSKFSTQDLRSAAKSAAASPTEQSLSLLEESPVIVGDDVFVDEDAHDRDGSGSDADTVLVDAKPPNLSKRKIVIEPIRTDFEYDSRPASRSDAHFSDDESLMDELQSATFQEAKPMFVAKSPITPVFPSSPSNAPGSNSGGVSPHMIRTVSNPVRGTFLAPGDVGQGSARSFSSGVANNNLAIKNNVGSSISQRIKALEKLSGGVAEANSHVVVTRDRPPSRASRPSSTFFSVRKGREPSRSPSVVDRAGSFTRQGRPPPSRSGSRDEEQPVDFSRQPRRERSGSVASRLSMFEPGGLEGYTPGTTPSSGNTPRGRPESISVTAKIIRDPGQKGSRSHEPPKDPSEFSHLELKQSPLLVDHQRATQGPVRTLTATSPIKESAQERRMSKEGRRSGSRDGSKDAKSRRSSFSVVKDFIKERRKSVTSPELLPSPPTPAPSQSPTRPSSVHQNSSSLSHRLSISSRRSSFSRDRDAALSPSATTESSGSGDEAKGSISDKKQSRSARFMRRLSTLSSARGKATTPTGISSTVTEEEAAEPAPISTTTTAAKPTHAPTPAGTPSIVSYMGDVNVQFPDNLLWKRRNLCLDSQGFLILSALPAQSGRAAVGTKRYHLSDLRRPYIPDVEIQELPNSVVLDLIEGSGVQIACVDRAGQMNVLKILQDAHAGHASTFGL